MLMTFKQFTCYSLANKQKIEFLDTYDIETIFLASNTIFQECGK